MLITGDLAYSDTDVRAPDAIDGEKVSKPDERGPDELEVKA